MRDLLCDMNGAKHSWVWPSFRVLLNNKGMNGIFTRLEVEFGLLAFSPLLEARLECIERLVYGFISNDSRKRTFCPLLAHPITDALADGSMLLEVHAILLVEPFDREVVGTTMEAKQVEVRRLILREYPHLLASDDLTVFRGDWHRRT